ncbi:hypothetical protein [Okeania sp. SIO2C2]|uniref:hypothetical protein n=1 Tax=Okeania sp. SIO2C2 TaxID=2607787 RepID=UPI00257D8F76|nr:hypothetical protein [Okeania sp. SIO2C2]
MGCLSFKLLIYPRPFLRLLYLPIVTVSVYLNSMQKEEGRKKKEERRRKNIELSEF